MTASYAIRTTCAPAVGMGHLRRCLTLAEELKRQGASSTFLLTGDPQGSSFIRAHGFRARPTLDLPGATASALDDLAPSTVIVDDYGFSEAEFSQVRARRPLAVIDDLADRRLDADLVLNSGASAESLPYRTAAGCKMLLGPAYALLRPGFRGLPRRAASGRVKRVLLTLGGADPRRLTVAVARQLLASLPEIRLDVVLGPLYGDASDLEAVVRDLGQASEVHLHRAPDDLAPLMAETDLAVCAGGQTTLELAAAGVPAVAICLADNQRGNLSAMSRIGTLVEAAEDEVIPAVRRLVADPSLRQTMSDTAQALVDGRGAVRVAEALAVLGGARA